MRPVRHCPAARYSVSCLYRLLLLDRAVYPLLGHQSAMADPKRGGVTVRPCKKVHYGTMLIILVYCLQCLLFVLPLQKYTLATLKESRVLRYDSRKHEK